MAKKSNADDRQTSPGAAQAGLADLGPARPIELGMQNQELLRAQVELGASRNRYLDLYDFAPVGYLTISDAGLIQEANLTAAGLLGVERKKLWGSSFAGFVGPRSLSRWEQLLSDIRKNAEQRGCDLALQRSDGSVFTGHLLCQRLTHGEAAPSMRVALTDVSASRKAEADLQLRESLLTAILDGTADGVLVVGSTGKVLRANRRFQALWRIPDDLLAAGDDERLLAYVFQQLADPEGFTREVRRLYLSTEDSLDTFALADGRVFERYSVPFVFDGPGGRLWSFRDVSDRVRAAAALQEREAKYRGLFNSLMDGLVVVDMSGAIRESNETYRRMLGYSLEELGRMTYRQLTPEAWHALEARIVAEQILPRGYSDVYEKEYRRKDGTVFPVELRTFLLREGGRPAAMGAIVRDVTDRKVTERALRASEARFRALADDAPVGIFETDAAGRTTYLNRVGVEIVGVPAEQVLSAGWQASIHPEDRERVSRDWSSAVSTGQVFSSEYRFQRSGGESVLVRGYASAIRDPSGQAGGYIGVITDITALRSIEQQLTIASRLAAMGTLVAGMAHEINNPLSVQLGNGALAIEAVGKLLDRVRGNAPPDREAERLLLEEVMDDLREAQAGGLRIQRIVKDLATFGRPDAKRRRVPLSDVVDAAIRWLPASVARSATIQVEPGIAPDILVAPGQIEQVLVNLITNAAKAMAAGKPAPITIRIGTGSIGMARLEVVDQGAGIDPAIQGRVFEPFFTTRDVGEGTGLGLSISHAIVTAHGGTVSVESVVGQGSTFRVELPAATPGD